MTDVSVTIASVRPEMVERAIESVHEDDTDIDYEVLVGACGWFNETLDATVIDIPRDWNLYKARNKLCDVATGDYIAVLDDDDMWLPGRFDDQYQMLENGADLVATKFQEGSLPGTMVLEHPSMMFRSAIRYREKFSLAGDWDLVLRAYDADWTIKPTDTRFCERDRSDSVSERRSALQNTYGAAAQIFHLQRKLTGDDQYDHWSPPIHNRFSPATVDGVEASLTPTVVSLGV